MQVRQLLSLIHIYLSQRSRSWQGLQLRLWLFSQDESLKLSVISKILFYLKYAGGEKE